MGHAHHRHGAVRGAGGRGGVLAEGWRRSERVQVGEGEAGGGRGVYWILLKGVFFTHVLLVFLSCS